MLWLLLGTIVPFLHSVECSSGSLNPFDDSIRYKLNWNAGLDSSLLSELEEEPVYIRTKSNERYVCRIPTGSKGNEKSSEEEDQSTASPNVLLSPLMEKQKCVQDNEAYWSYEYCFGAKLRQYRADVVDGRRKITAEYILGKDTGVPAAVSELKKGEAPAPIPKKRIGEQDFPYYSIVAKDGTPCDLSGTPRKAEIIFICLEDLLQARLISVKETQTCEYEAIVAVPQLCTNPMYLLPKEKVHGIQCSPVGAAPRKPSSLIEGTKANVPAEFVHVEISGNDKLVYLRRGAGAPSPAEQQTTPEQPSETVIQFGEPSPSGGAASPPSDRPKTPAYPETPLSPDKAMIKQFLSGEFCLDGGSGYWLYEFCYGKQVLQYHNEPNSRKRVEILLGRWDSTVHKQWIAQSPRRKKNGHFYYSGGDVCDLTQKPRSVVVKMRCKKGNFHPNQVAMSLQEPSTCNYVLSVESSIFCSLLDTTDEDGNLKLPDL